jgi:hypothetical protein
MMHRKRTLRRLHSCALTLALTATVPATPAAADVPLPWQIDLRTPTEGLAELSAVDVVPAQTWVGGSELNPKTRKNKPIVGLWGTGGLVPLPGPGTDPSLDVRLTDLAVIGDDVLAVANTTSTAGITQPVIQRYSRTHLGESETLPGPTLDTYGELNAITPLSDGRALTVGTTGPNSTSTQTLVVEETQDHSGWLRIPSPSPGTGTNQLNTVTVSNSKWAAGHYTQRDEPGRSHALVLHDAGPGTGWTQIVVPDPGPNFNELTGITVTGNGDVFVVGWTGSANSRPEDRQAVAMHWNQTTWEVLQPWNADETQFNAVVVDQDGTVLFAGYSIEGSAEIASLERWTGSPHLQPVPIILPPRDDINNAYPASGINAIDTSPTSIQPCAVGWLRQSDQVMLDATLRPPA